jgi:hypothetical protein
MTQRMIKSKCMKTIASDSLHDNEKANVLSTTLVRMRILSPEMQRLLLDTGRIATLYY